MRGQYNLQGGMSLKVIAITDISMYLITIVPLLDQFRTKKKYRGTNVSV
jgi:hypothetical protein